jgi:hypothetical protein
MGDLALLPALSSYFLLAAAPSLSLPVVGEIAIQQLATSPEPRMDTLSLSLASSGGCLLSIQYGPSHTCLVFNPAKFALVVERTGSEPNSGDHGGRSALRERRRSVLLRCPRSQRGQ